DTDAARREGHQDAVRVGRWKRTYAGGSRAVIRGHAGTHSPDRGEGAAEVAAPIAFAEAASILRRTVARLSIENRIGKWKRERPVKAGRFRFGGSVLREERLRSFVAGYAVLWFRAGASGELRVDRRHEASLRGGPAWIGCCVSTERDESVAYFGRNDCAVQWL